MGLWNYCFGDFYMKDNVITPNCKACRIRMEKTGPARLFLLPCWHGESYQPSAEYYLRNCSGPIAGVEEIPTGRRACRVQLCRCPQCGVRRVMVQDFLQVRGAEYHIYRRDYDIQELSALLR